MVVIVLESAPDKIRGELTRWFLETKPGVFVGKVNTRVREKLWEKICYYDTQLNGILIYSAPTEQGFKLEMTGDPKRKVIEFDGIQLIKKKE